MSSAKQIHAFLEVSEMLLRQSHAWLADDTLQLSSWSREVASRCSDGQLTALRSTRGIETAGVSAPAGETDLTIERNF